MVSVGRPTKYTDEILVKAEEYIATYIEIGDEIPSNAGLAVFLGVSRDTVQVWYKDKGKEAFSYILDQIQAKQEQRLLSKGLNGGFNSSIAKLVLGKHGYHDKRDIEQNTTLKLKGIPDGLRILRSIRRDGQGESSEDTVSG